eukprot:10854565-Ditylum_brightwellii.AAC.1
MRRNQWLRVEEDRLPCSIDRIDRSASSGSLRFVTRSLHFVSRSEIFNNQLFPCYRSKEKEITAFSPEMRRNQWLR